MNVRGWAYGQNMPTDPGTCGPPAVETSRASAPARGAAQQALDTLNDLVGAVAAANAMMNSLSAWRAELMEAVRTWSVQSTDLLVDDPWAPRAQHTAHLAVVAELACALSLPEQTTSALVDDAQILVETCPATLAALREGVISYRHAQVVLEHTDGLEQAQREDLERRLLAQAPGLTASTFARRARKERERSHPAPLVERHAAALPKRCVQLDPARDGMAWLHQYLPAVEAVAIFNRVSDIAAAVQHPSDPRSLPELRADAFSALMLDDDAHDAFRRARDGGAGTDGKQGRDGRDSTVGGPDRADHDDSPPRYDWGPTGARPLDRGRLLRGIQATVAVTVPVLALLGHSDSPATLEGYGPMDAETARILAGRARSFRRILTHPETGVVLSVGRDRYAVPADLRAALRLRDETCRFPGCSRRARRCDLDHITDWALGGTTDHDNLMTVCRRHHRLKHLSTWRPRLLNQADVPAEPEPESGRRAQSGPSTPVRRPEGPGQSEPSAPISSRPPPGLFDAAVEWTAPSGRAYTSDPPSNDHAPRLSFAYLVSLGLSADFLLRIGVTPTSAEDALRYSTASEADTEDQDWGAARSSRRAADRSNDPSAVRSEQPGTHPVRSRFPAVPPF